MYKDTPIRRSHPSLLAVHLKFKDEFDATHFRYFSSQRQHIACPFCVACTVRCTTYKTELLGMSNYEVFAG